MKFSWEWLKELSGTALGPQKAAELLTSKAFEVEGVEDGVLSIDILPNRSDCLSHLGVARELCVLESKRFAAPSYEYRIAEQPSFVVRVDDTEGCLRFSALVVRNVKVGPSPKWLAARLEACGLRSINAVVDVTNYVMLELGQPMHAFDMQKVKQIVVRRAKAGETLKALDEARTEYELQDSMLVVTDGEMPLAIAGVKGGADSGITDTTTDIVLEAATWQPETVRATSRALGLRTDASIRFSYGTDPAMPPAALVRAAQLLKEVASGEASEGIIDVYPEPRHAWQIAIDPMYAQRLLGAALSESQMRGILESLGLEVEEKEGKFIVTVPTRRLDLVGPEDIIEEIGRVYGYDAIVAMPPVLPLYDEKSWVRGETDVPWDEYAFIRERSAIGHLLAGAGYSEVYNYAFLSDELKELLGLDGLTELALPQSAEYRWLRTSLVPRLIVNARDNLRFFDEIRLFEVGHVFKGSEGKEPAHLGMLCASRGSADTFLMLKGAVDLLLERLGIEDFYYDDAAPFLWDDAAVDATAKGHQALIRQEGTGTILGFIGGVSDRIGGALKMKGRAAVAELNLRALVTHAQEEREFAPLPRYPSVTRDIAVLVDQGVKVGDIIQTVRSVDSEGIIDDVDVFDIFVPTGKEKLKTEGDTPEYGKSVAFHVIFRATDRTLRDDEVAKVEAEITQALQEKLNARVR